MDNLPTKGDSSDSSSSTLNWKLANDEQPQQPQKKGITAATTTDQYIATKPLNSTTKPLENKRRTPNHVGLFQNEDIETSAKDPGKEDMYHNKHNGSENKPQTIREDHDIDQLCEDEISMKESRREVVYNRKPIHSFHRKPEDKSQMILLEHQHQRVPFDMGQHLKVKALMNGSRGNGVDFQKVDSVIDRIGKLSASRISRQAAIFQPLRALMNGPRGNGLDLQKLDSVIDRMEKVTGSRVSLQAAPFQPPHPPSRGIASTRSYGQSQDPGSHMRNNSGKSPRCDPLRMPNGVERLSLGASVPLPSLASSNSPTASNNDPVPEPINSATARAEWLEHVADRLSQESGSHIRNNSGKSPRCDIPPPPPRRPNGARVLSLSASIPPLMSTPSLASSNASMASDNGPGPKPINCATARAEGLEHVTNLMFSDRFGGTGLYTGECDTFGRPDGQGKMKYDGGKSFQGSWMNGVPCAVEFQQQNCPPILQQHPIMAAPSGLSLPGTFVNPYFAHCQGPFMYGGGNAPPPHIVNGAAGVGHPMLSNPMFGGYNQMMQGGVPMANFQGGQDTGQGMGVMPSHYQSAP